MAKLWVFVDFSNKRRFKKYIKLLHKKKLWDELQEEAVGGRYSVKKLFLKISQNSPENTFVGVSFLVKLQASDLKLY